MHELRFEPREDSKLARFILKRCVSLILRGQAKHSQPIKLTRKLPCNQYTLRNTKIHAATREEDQNGSGFKILGFMQCSYAFIISRTHSSRNS